MRTTIRYFPTLRQIITTGGDISNEKRRYKNVIQTNQWTILRNPIPLHFFNGIRFLGNEVFLKLEVEIFLYFFCVLSIDAAYNCNKSSFHVLLLDNIHRHIIFRRQNVVELVRLKSSRLALLVWYEVMGI